VEMNLGLRKFGNVEKYKCGGSIRSTRSIRSIRSIRSAGRYEILSSPEIGLQKSKQDSGL